MCDTIVALGPATRGGVTLFGKNSDREPDEAQNLVILPGGEHGSEESLRCTHVSVAQARRTFRTLLCQPFWMFGAEMGANEHGVVIGNEAIFTREKPAHGGLTGMDLLRLALERSRTAREALDTIISLLERHGQGGRSGYRQNLRYMNGFLIADREEAYVLETVRSWWAWKKVTGLWSISNIISLEEQFDDCSTGLIQNAVNKGYCRSESDFNFRRCYSDRLYTWGAKGAERESRSRALLEARKGKIDTHDFMAVLRDHGGNPGWSPDRQRGGTVCMHAANRLTRPTQSVGSLVARLGDNRRAVFYVTGSSNPCMSPFFPLTLEAGLPAGYRAGAAEYEEASCWWQSERLHRRALTRFQGALAAVKMLIADYEQRMVAELEGEGKAVDQATVDDYFSRARSLVDGWGRDLERIVPGRTGWLYRRYWRRYKRLNRVPDRL